MGDNLEGEARELGRARGCTALAVQEGRERPLLLLSGGETSLTVAGDCRVGPEDSAGALFAPTDWSRARDHFIRPVAPRVLFH